MRNGMRPVPPGEILGMEMQELGLSAAKIATYLGVPTNRVTAILNKTRSITPDTALRLAAFFNTTAQFWINLQTNYDLRTVEINDGNEIRKTVKRYVSK